jgi:hypothetical protein
MFKGAIKGDLRRRTKSLKYSKEVEVIFNLKAYANTENLKQWVQQQYKWSTPFSPSDIEP